MRWYKLFLLTLVAFQMRAAVTYTLSGSYSYTPPANDPDYYEDRSSFSLGGSITTASYLDGNSGAIAIDGGSSCAYGSQDGGIYAFDKCTMGVVINGSTADVDIYGCPVTYDGICSVFSVEFTLVPDEDGTWYDTDDFSFFGQQLPGSASLSISGGLLNDPPMSVPEPALWPILLGSAGVVGILKRRRRSV